MIHGSYSTYANYKCRCDECRAAASVARREYRIRKGITKGGTTRVAPHPSRSKYAGGCRCEGCYAAHLAYHEARRRAAGMRKRGTGPPGEGSSS